MNRQTEFNAIPKLYHWPLSPFCRKVRMVLEEKRVEYENIVVRFWETDTNFHRLNSCSTVPFFCNGKLAISESNAICEYLEETATLPALLPSDPVARAEVRRMVAWFDGMFYQDVTTKLLYERAYRRLMGRGSPDSRAIKEGTRNIRRHIDFVGGLLHDRRWLAGDQISLADFTAAAHFSSLDYISDVNWNQNISLRNWYATMKSRPCFKGILRDIVPGLPQPRHYADLDF